MSKKTGFSTGIADTSEKGDVVTAIGATPKGAIIRLDVAGGSLYGFLPVTRYVLHWGGTIHQIVVAP